MGIRVMADVLRRILYPAFVLTIIATVWAMGHAQAMAHQAYGQTYWPPLNPELFRFDERSATADAGAAEPTVAFDEQR